MAAAVQALDETCVYRVKQVAALFVAVVECAQWLMNIEDVSDGRGSTSSSKEENKSSAKHQDSNSDNSREDNFKKLVSSAPGLFFPIVKVRAYLMEVLTSGSSFDSESSSSAERCSGSSRGREKTLVHKNVVDDDGVRESKDDRDENYMEREVHRRVHLDAASIDRIRLLNSKRKLTKTAEKYDKLKTVFDMALLKHAKTNIEKDKITKSLKTELIDANSLLKEVQNEFGDNANSELSASHAAASRLIRAGMSYTELYSLYVKASEDLEMQQQENVRLKRKLERISNELSVIKGQGRGHDKVLNELYILGHQRNDLIAKNNNLEEMLANKVVKLKHLKRENYQLKQAQRDLSRQVCHLLKEIEQLRCYFTGDTSETQAIQLVTFKNIFELQKNNEELLSLVRDLNNQLEEADLLNKIMKNNNEKIEDILKTLNQRNDVVAFLVSKCEKYKKMNLELQKQCNLPLQMNLSDTEDDDPSEKLQERDECNIQDQEKTKVGELATTNREVISTLVKQMKLLQQLDSDKIHQETMNFPKDAIEKMQQSQSTADSEVDRLRYENQVLKDAAACYKVAEASEHDRPPRHISTESEPSLSHKHKHQRKDEDDFPTGADL